MLSFPQAQKNHFFHFPVLFHEAISIPSLNGNNFIDEEIVVLHIFLLFVIGVLPFILLLELKFDSCHEIRVLWRNHLHLDLNLKKL
jgi:hypothetical protein